LLTCYKRKNKIIFPSTNSPSLPPLLLLLHHPPFISNFLFNSHARLRQERIQQSSSNFSLLPRINNNNIANIQIPNTKPSSHATTHQTLQFSFFTCSIKTSISSESSPHSSVSCTALLHYLPTISNPTNKFTCKGIQAKLFLVHNSDQNLYKYFPRIRNIIIKQLNTSKHQKLISTIFVFIEKLGFQVNSGVVSLWLRQSSKSKLKLQLRWVL
jgi:hypothetical protein